MRFLRSIPHGVIALMVSFPQFMSWGAPPESDLSPRSLFKKLNAISLVTSKIQDFDLKPAGAFSVRLSSYKEPSSSFGIGLPSKITGRSIPNARWDYAHAQVFYEPLNRVKQVAIIAKSCGHRDKPALKEKLTSDFIAVVKKVQTKALVLDGPLLQLDAPLKSLGPRWDRHSEVFVPQQLPHVRKVRLSRGRSKCDSMGGFQLRLDYFF